MCIGATWQLCWRAHLWFRSFGLQTEIHIFNKLPSCGCCYCCSIDHTLSSKEFRDHSWLLYLIFWTMLSNHIDHICVCLKVSTELYIEPLQTQGQYLPLVLVTAFKWLASITQLVSDWAKSWGSSIALRLLLCACFLLSVNGDVAQAMLPGCTKKDMPMCWQAIALQIWISKIFYIIWKL